ncbi:osteopontin [Alligator mississippiensis]|uniref:Osteopontin n=2 Tax=Alligator mississippiensis TaxID=8496 RepID=A0A151NNL8_ALLMI|nr:osteopontin [Alligator mississippiensis]
MGLINSHIPGKVNITMKTAVLCLCLIGIAFALPVSKSKHRPDSRSSEERDDSRSHHHHRHHLRVQTESRVSPPWAQEVHVLPQQTSFSSEESVEVPKRQIFQVASRSTESEDDHDDDSNDTDESDEDAVTDFPTDFPVTETFPPFSPTRGDNSGRGDSVGYRMRAKAKLVKSSRHYQATGKFIVHDATEEGDSTPDTESQQVDYSKPLPAAHLVPGKYDISVEWDDKSHMKDSNEVISRSRDDSHQRLESVEVDTDDSKPDVPEDSHMSNESREQHHTQISASVPETDADSNQTAESAEDIQDHHSLEDNEVTI